jgi:hypothetical protein
MGGVGAPGGLHPASRRVSPAHWPPRQHPCGAAGTPCVGTALLRAVVPGVTQSPAPDLRPPSPARSQQPAITAAKRAARRRRLPRRPSPQSDRGRRSRRGAAPAGVPATADPRERAPPAAPPDPPRPPRRRARRDGEGRVQGQQRAGQAPRGAQAGGRVRDGPRARQGRVRHGAPGACRAPPAARAGRAPRAAPAPAASIATGPRRACCGVGERRPVALPRRGGGCGCRRTPRAANCRAAEARRVRRRAPVAAPDPLVGSSAAPAPPQQQRAAAATPRPRRCPPRGELPTPRPASSRRARTWPVERPPRRPPPPRPAPPHRITPLYTTLPGPQQVYARERGGQVHLQVLHHVQGGRGGHPGRGAGGGGGGKGLPTARAARAGRAAADAAAGQPATRPAPPGCC